MVLVLEKQRWCTGASSTSTVALSTASLSTSTKKPDAMHDFSPTIIPEEPNILRTRLGTDISPFCVDPNRGGYIPD